MNVQHRLRESINNSLALRNEIYQKKDGSWDRLWASMDALEDSQVAIDDYQKKVTISYLELYGLLQAFVIQQDAIDHIRQTTIGVEQINWKGGEEPILKGIRDIRVETAGHPSNIKTSRGTVYCNIDRSSITQNGFDYIIWSKLGPAHKKANIKDMVDGQRREIIKLMVLTISDIKNKEEAFKKLFADKKIKVIYDKVGSYQFQKLYMYENNPEFAGSMFKTIKTVYGDIRMEMEKRYGTFSSTINSPGLKIVIDELDELINRLGGKFTAGVTDLFDYLVYVEALEAKWKELGVMIEETDNKFS